MWLMEITLGHVWFVLYLMEETICSNQYNRDYLILNIFLSYFETYKFNSCNLWMESNKVSYGSCQLLT